MKIRTTKFKEWDYWYEEQCKAKKKEVKRAMKGYKREMMALKEYKKGDDERCRSRYCSCIMEYEKLLEEKKSRMAGQKRNQNR
jgi:hypothetical protein